MKLALLRHLLSIAIVCISSRVFGAEPAKSETKKSEAPKVLGASETPKARNVELKYRCEIADLPAGAKTVDLWIPIPVSNERQTVRLLNEKVYELHPGAITAAEESTAFPAVSRPTYLGGLGFTFKWNMGWMHDTLDYIALDPVYRKYHHQKLTFGLMYAFSENFILPISHDEVVHLKRAMADKMPGDLWQKLANLRLYYGFMWTHPGKKLLFMGQDFGQWHEWDESRSLDWHLTESEPHQRLQKWIADLNRLYASEPCLHQNDYDWSGFEWIDANDWEHSVLSYIRRASDRADYMIMVANFTPVVREGYRVGVPDLCTYVEVLNSDSAIYGGSNVGNGLGLPAQELQWQSQPYSIEMTLPPLSIVILRPERPREVLG